MHKIHNNSAIENKNGYIEYAILLGIFSAMCIVYCNN